jgi:hypothetical protein
MSPTATTSLDERAQERRRRARSQLPDDRYLRWGLIAAGAILGVLLIWLLVGLVRGPGERADTAATGAAQATRALRPTATATPAPTPTPAPTKGRIVNLAGGPGLLHQTPGFDTPTLEIVLKEGDEVELLGRTKKDPAGNDWVLVAAGDYVGWSPANNVAVGP